MNGSSKRIVKKDLDFAQTKGYFLEHIEGKRSLDKILLENLEFQKGRFFIYLREDAKIDRLYQFEEGEINPKISSNEVHFIEGIGEFIPHIWLSTDREVSKFIKEYLCKDDLNFAICEDAIQDVEDNPLVIPNVDVHFYKNEVYYSLTGQNSVEDIYTTINRTDNFWHSLVVLTSGKRLSQKLQAEDFASICANVHYVLTSAHDGENYIIWEKSTG